MSVALYPGSFDPIHKGHVAVIATAASVFERVIVAVGHNPAKPSGMFSVDERIAMINESVADRKNISVVAFTGLVTGAATDHQATCLVKGIRSGTDLDAEMLQANMNATTGGGLPTLFVAGIGSSALISSRYVREIASAGGDVSAVVPDAVMKQLAQKGK